MKFPIAFVEDKPRAGSTSVHYQVFNRAGLEVAAGRGENWQQANEMAVRLLNLLCEPDAETPAIPF